MIIDNTYFKGEIYIPHAKPSVVSVADGVPEQVTTFINEYEKDALVNCLGYKLYAEFVSNIDENEETLIAAEADEKWGFLMNGKEYVNSSGDTVKWPGLRYKDPGSTTFSSLLAYYVYFFYESQNYVVKSNSMSTVPKAKNATTVVPNQSIVNAWRKFYQKTQEKTLDPVVYNTDYGIGIDYYVTNGEVSLYQFINDQNKLVEDTYEDFRPKRWENMNQFGI